MILESRFDNSYYTRYLIVFYQVYVSRQDYIRTAEVNVKLNDFKLIKYLYLAGRL